MTDYKHTHTHTRARAHTHTHTHTRPFRVLQTGTRCDRHRKPRPTSSTHVKRSTPTGSMSTTKQQPHKRPHLRAKQQRRPAGKIACWLRRILWRRRPTQRRQRWGQRPTAALRLRIRVWGVSLCLTRPQLRDMVQKDCNGAGGTASPPAVRIDSETYRCNCLHGLGHKCLDITLISLLAHGRRTHFDPTIMTIEVFGSVKSSICRAHGCASARMQCAVKPK